MLTVSNTHYNVTQPEMTNQIWWQGSQWQREKHLADDSGANAHPNFITTKRKKMKQPQRKRKTFVRFKDTKNMAIYIT
jgi:hypothetical protein